MRKVSYLKRKGILVFAFAFFWMSCLGEEPTYEGLPLYYWQQKDFVNFGDYLALVLVERITQSSVRIFRRHPKNKEKKLLATGSLLYFAKENDVLWGTGFNDKTLAPRQLGEFEFKSLDVRAVRGPLTKRYLKERFNIDCPEIYGDPALLFPYLFPEFKKKEKPQYEYIVIPHFLEQKLFPKEQFPQAVYPTEPWEDIIEKILDSKFVISSSLHGIVIAEAYGIPARWLRISEKEPLFKYHDYYLGTNRALPQYATSIEEALELGGEPPIDCDLERLYAAFPFEYWPNAEIRYPLVDIPPLPSDPFEFHQPFAEEDDSSEIELNDSPFVNLERHPDDFVLETKQIIIPGYPDAFNPSIAKWGGQLIICFRFRDKINNLPNQVGFIWMDEALSSQSSPYVLQVHTKHIQKIQDPRLITVKDRLYMIFSSPIKGLLSDELRRMFVAEVHFDGRRFFINDFECLKSFAWENQQRWEKNWAPFVYQEQLLLSYSISPHRVLRPLKGTGSCETVSTSGESLAWNWGTLHGGTPALRCGESYIAFFHSSTKMASAHSAGKNIPHYFMGAYAFSPTPPFEVTHVSPRPIIGEHFYDGPPHKTWRPIRVIFPGGFIQDENYIWVFFGKQDHEIWFSKIDKKKLLSSFVPT